MRIDGNERGVGPGILRGRMRGSGRRISPTSRKICPDLALNGLRVAACALLFIASAFGQGSKPTEYQVKAVYIYNFSRFVEWPAKPTQTVDGFIICVLGRDPFGDSLKSALANVTIAGKKIEIKLISSPQEAENCRVLFISDSEEKRLKHILEDLDGASILTVSDMPEFTERGGMMQFVWEGDRVRFEVNLATAERAGLSLSSELLKVAVNVKGASPRGD
jgi:uncharacterized protein DUF4154